MCDVNWFTCCLIMFSKNRRLQQFSMSAWPLACQNYPFCSQFFAAPKLPLPFISYKPWHYSTIEREKVESEPTLPMPFHSACLCSFFFCCWMLLKIFCTKIKLNKCNLTPRDEWSCSDCIFLMFFTHLASCLKNNLDYTLTGLCRKQLFVLTCSMLYSFTMLHMQSNELRSKDLLANVDVIQYPTFPIG